MSEYMIGYLAIGNIAALALACLFYMMGGRENKWIRRYIGSFVLALAINITSLLLDRWTPYLLVMWPLFIGEFCLGYGGDDHAVRIFKRSVICALSIFAGILLSIIFGNWWLLIPHALCSAGTVLFAVKNPVAAASEEPLVCLLNNAVLLFFPFIGA